MAVPAPAAAPWDALLQGEELVHLEHVPGVAARELPLPAALAPELVRALLARGIGSVYTHQAEDYEAEARGG